MDNKKKLIDWAWIEIAYKSGLNPKEIVDEHYKRTGVTITRAAVTMRAKRKGWPNVAERDARIRERKKLKKADTLLNVIGSNDHNNVVAENACDENSNKDDVQSLTKVKQCNHGSTSETTVKHVNHGNNSVNRADPGGWRSPAEIDNEVRESERRAVIDRQLAVLDDLDRQASAVLSRAQQLLDHADRPGDVRDLAQAVDKMAHLRIRQLELIRRWLGLDDADNNNHGHVTQIAIVVDGERVSERVIQG